MAASTSAAGASRRPRTTARSRSTAGWRDGVASDRDRRRAAGQAGDGHLGDDDPPAREVELLERAPGGAHRRGPARASPGDRPAQRGRGAGVGSSASGVVDRARQAEPLGDSSSMSPLASSRSPAGRVRSQAGGAVAPVSAKPRRHHSSAIVVVRGPVALADLEDRHVVATLARVRRPRPRAGSPTRLWRTTECWLDSGLVTVDRPAAGRPSPGRDRAVVGARSARPSTARRARRSRPRTGRRPRAVSRTRSRSAQRRGPVGGHRRVRQDARDHGS